MLKTIYNWLTVNQVWHDLIVLVVSILLTPYITRFLATAKKLISIPPQRLNVWILKARISAEDATLQDLYRLRSDLPYLIVALAECMMYLFVSVSVMGCFTFIKLVKSLKLLPPIGFRNVFLRFYFDSDVFLQVYFFVLLVVCTVVVKRIKTIVTLSQI